VVLRARERHDAGAVDDRDEARFLAGEEVFDDDLRSGLAELPLAQHAIQRLLRVGDGRSDDDALPAASPSALMTIGALRGARNRAPP
jgi:hypothetical protein